MAQMIISLRCDPVTGKKDIVIKLHSDPDALPQEHEQQHRALVDKLIEGGVLKAAEVGKVVVERQEEEKAPATPSGNVAEGERRARGQGS
jgi:hypothetical protein